MDPLRETLEPVIEKFLQSLKPIQDNVIEQERILALKVKEYDELNLTLKEKIKIVMKTPLSLLAD